MAQTHHYHISVQCHFPPLGGGLCCSVDTQRPPTLLSQMSPSSYTQTGMSCPQLNATPCYWLGWLVKRDLVLWFTGSQMGRFGKRIKFQLVPSDCQGQFFPPGILVQTVEPSYLAMHRTFLVQDESVRKFHFHFICFCATNRKLGKVGANKACINDCPTNFFIELVRLLTPKCISNKLHFAVTVVDQECLQTKKSSLHGHWSLPLVELLHCDGQLS